MSNLAQLTRQLESLDIADLMLTEEAVQQHRYASRYPVGTEIMHNMRRSEKLIVVGLPKNSPNYIIKKPDGSFRLMFASDVCATLRLPVDPYKDT